MIVMEEAGKHDSKIILIFVFHVVTHFMPSLQTYQFSSSTPNLDWNDLSDFVSVFL